MTETTVWVELVHANIDDLPALLCVNHVEEIAVRPMTSTIDEDRDNISPVGMFVATAGQRGTLLCRYPSARDALAARREFVRTMSTLGHGHWVLRLEEDGSVGVVEDYAAKAQVKERQS